MHSAFFSLFYENVFLFRGSNDIVFLFRGSTILSFYFVVLTILSFYPVGSFVLGVEGDSFILIDIQMRTFTPEAGGEHAQTNLLNSKLSKA